MKKIIGFVIALTLITGTMSNAFAAKFADLSDKKWDWARNYVEDMAKEGYITGYEDGTFRPAQSITKQEGLVLFARAMGASNDTNKEIIDIAIDKYGALLDTYSLTYSKDEIAFLLYRGALKETELDTYLKGNLKNAAMKRYEAAIIITKAMGDEKTAKSNVLTDLDYKDALDIPIEAINYVYYVTNAGIMQGMEDSKFSPNTDVLRCQMAAMLSRTVEKMNPKFSEVKIVSVDEESKNITAKTTDGETKYCGFTNDTALRVDGELVQVKDFPSGVDAVITHFGSSVKYIDALSSIPDQTVSGIYNGYSNTSNELKISMTPNKNGDSTAYPCSKDVAIYYNGSPASLADFKTNDQITLYITRGKVAKAECEPQEKTIKNATVKSIEIDPEFKMTITHADDEYNNMSFVIDENVSVKKNNEASDFRSIYTGDKVNLTLKYGKITKVVAESTEKKVTGQIVSVGISTAPTITVKIDGEEQTYEIPKSTTIFVNGAAGTLYDLRVGDTVKLTLDSKAVTSIETTVSTSTAKVVQGIVENINSSYGFITVKVTDESGNVSTETIFAKSDVLVVDLLGSKKNFKSIKQGDEIAVTGSMYNGAFDAAVITLMTKSK